MSRKFYIYIHKIVSDNSVFYVGKGTGNRAWKFSNRNYKWMETSKNKEIDVKIILTNLTEEEAFKFEKEIISFYIKSGFCLANLTSGGGKGYTFSDEILYLIGSAMRGKNHTEEAKKKLSDANKGKTISEEIRQKISKSNKGRKRDLAFCKKLSEINSGKKLSKETCRKISNANKGKIVSAKTRELLSQANKDKKLSKETKLKISLASKNRVVTEATKEKHRKRMTGSQNPRTDLNVYTFEHKSGKLYTGTRQNFSLEFNIKACGLSKLFRDKDKRKTYKGWKVLHLQNLK